MALADPGTVSALIFTPHGRDAVLAEALLREVGIDSTICRDPSALKSALNENVSFVVATEEALLACDLEAIAKWLSRQPAWSDLPFIVLTHGGRGSDPNPVASRLANTLGNVSFLERPFRAATFISAARTAFKARQRQYEARARIEELHEGEERLRIALVAGRLGAWELDLPRRKLIASESCKAVFGLDPQAPISFEDLVAGVHPEDRGRVQAAFFACVERDEDLAEDLAIEYRNVWTDGSIHWAELRASSRT